MTSRELDRIRGIADPRERAKASHALIEDLRAQSAEASGIRKTAIGELIPRGGVSRVQAADLLGVSRERIRQILAEGPPPERALLAPDPGPVTFAVVQKRDSESGGPALANSTRKALTALEAAAAALDIETAEERIGKPGWIDLNRGNLAVLIGPRISALIVQALSADPVIRWRQDRRELGYLTDTKTGEEFRSDFDDGWQAGGERTCIAHIGRIRRPDGQGSFLYLGGAHAPGTAGAVAYFIREMPAIWEQVRRSPLWSAVVRTIADDDGTPVSSELVTPVYTHGKP
jgi:hypothetical protein